MPWRHGVRLAVHEAVARDAVRRVARGRRRRLRASAGM